MVSELDPYRPLSDHPQLASDSILKAPATTPSESLYHAVRQGDAFVAALALTAVFFKLFILLLLSNIHFHITQTWMTHVVVAWLAASTLVFMLPVVLVTLGAIRWPYMPVKANTIARCRYYVCDSIMFLDLEELSCIRSTDSNSRTNRERSAVVEEVRSVSVRYRFGEIFGMSGSTRIGVN